MVQPLVVLLWTTMNPFANHNQIRLLQRRSLQLLLYPVMSNKKILYVFLWTLKKTFFIRPLKTSNMLKTMGGPGLNKQNSDLSPTPTVKLKITQPPTSAMSNNDLYDPPPVIYRNYNFLVCLGVRSYFQLLFVYKTMITTSFCLYFHLYATIYLLYAICLRYSVAVVQSLPWELLSTTNSCTAILTTLLGGTEVPS